MRLVLSPRLLSGFVASAIFVCSALAMNSVFAASSCKGLEQSQCESSASCGWVKSYERKDGRTVKAFCRSSGKKQVSADKKTASPTSGAVATADN